MINPRVAERSKPVTIITGFLGAGKTTFLNALIAFYRENDKKVLIIENEFGEENIDSELVIGADNGLFGLSNGCLCCNLNEELFDLLDELWEQRDSFDELIIETTGIADPAAVAIPFLTNPSVARHYRLERVIGLVDAPLIEATLSRANEAGRQISFSDILLITKTDAVFPGELVRTKEILNEINPFAIVLSGNKADGYPLKQITGYIRAAHMEGSEPPDENESHCEHDHHHEHHHHTGHHDIVSFSFCFSDPMDVEKLELRLMLLLNLQAENIYRVKGIVYACSDKRMVLQSVSNLLSVSEGRPWSANEQRNSRIVFIGKQLNPHAFEAILRQCLVSKKKMKAGKTEKAQNKNPLH